MTQTANNYGTVLFELGITKEIVEKTKEIFELTSELPRVLNCPVVSQKRKAPDDRKIFSAGDTSFFERTV